MSHPVIIGTLYGLEHAVPSLAPDFFKVPSGADLEEYYQYLLRQLASFLDLLYFYIELGLVLFSVLALLGAGFFAYLLYSRIRHEGFDHSDFESPFYDEISGHHYDSDDLRINYSQDPEPARHGHVIDYHACLEVLGLPVGSNVSSIKHAYRMLARQFHPDTRVSQDGLEEEKFHVIRRAYDTLMELEKHSSFITQRADPNH